MYISIVLATYNGELYIEKQLKSIAKQTLLPNELIISDDGSTDSTLSICRHFSEEAIFSVIITENQNEHGYAKNFENALSYCKGQVVLFADQDDVWFEDKIERIVSVFENDSAVGLVYSDAIVVNEELQPTGETVFSTRGKSEVWKGDDRDPLDLIRTPNIKGCTMAIRSKYLPFALPIPLVDSKEYWGHDHWIALVTTIMSRTEVISKPLLYYRIHDLNTSGSIQTNRSKHTSFFLIWKKKYKYSSNTVDSKLYKYQSIESFYKKLSYDEIESCKRDSAQNIHKVLTNEIDLLKKRKEIWYEKNTIKRIKKVVLYLINKKYFRFNKWVGPLVKDIIGYYS